MTHRIQWIRPLLAWLVLLTAVLFAAAAAADETCNSPYMTGLIKGQEDYVHVWTLGGAGEEDLPAGAARSVCFALATGLNSTTRLT